MAENKQMKEALTDVEREQLRELIQHPGWTIYRKIQDSFIESIRSGTQVVSLNDPLNNKDAIANLWAYFGMAARLKVQVEKGIEHEISMLRKSEAPKRTPEEERKRRVAWFGTGQIGDIPENFEAPKH